MACPSADMTLKACLYTGTMTLVVYWQKDCSGCRKHQMSRTPSCTVGFAVGDTCHGIPCDWQAKSVFTASGRFFSPQGCDTCCPTATRSGLRERSVRVERSSFGVISHNTRVGRQEAQVRGHTHSCSGRECVAMQ